ncbi:hypothetical protein [Spiroplasma endosymbiont of Asaphidion curtum]|uniref:hypothetical protein n=1 Tax=Spiroplasma endosymbiont of Asaphidion curtum TaxID=3066281 RepID=UPI00313CD592
MHKIISWFIIMFISLVPLGAFFDTKQPPKPNMEQSSFMKRQKRTTNPSQCGNSCELEFSEILNTVLFRDNYSLNIESVKNKLPADVLASTSGYALFEISSVDGSSWQKIINFYKDNGVKSSDNNRYNIDKIINAKITLTKFESRHYYITSLDFLHYLFIKQNSYKIYLK